MRDLDCPDGYFVKHLVGTPWERFVDATRRVVSVSKEEIDKMRAARERKKRSRRRKRD
jgi:hypothetical protein